MNKKLVLLLTIAIVSLAAACGSTTNTNNVNSNTATPSPTKAAILVDLSSPKATLTAFVEAVKKKDITTIKATLSKSALSVAKETGGGDIDKAINDTLNENKGAIPASIEIKDEKTEGDKATLQAKDADGKWIEAKFVKEGAEWKYDMFAAIDSMGSDDKSGNKKAKDKVEKANK